MHAERLESGHLQLILDPREAVLLSSAASGHVDSIQIGFALGQFDEDFATRALATLVDLHDSVLRLEDDEIVEGSAAMHRTHEHDEAFYAELEAEMRATVAKRRGNQG